MHCCSKRCSFIWIDISAYTMKTSCCISFPQHFLKSKKTSIFLINQAKLQTMKWRGGGGGSPWFVLISRVWKFYISFKEILKTKKRKTNNNNKTKKQAVPDHLCLLRQNMFLNVWLALSPAIWSYIQYEGQQLNHLFQSNNWTLPPF